MQRHVALCLVLLAAGLGPGVLGQAEVSFRPGRTYQGQSSSGYLGVRVNWKGLISACRAAGRYERRLFNYFLRAAFHDSLARSDANCPRCSGPDGSLCKFAAEQKSDANFGWSNYAAPYITAIAQQYKASIADTTAVCGAVAIEELSLGRIRMIGASRRKDFTVGRLDARAPAVDGILIGGLSDAPTWSSFFTTGGLTVQEGVALMASHANLVHFGCLNTDGTKVEVDPSINTDDSGLIDVTMPDSYDPTQLQMFTLNNQYFQDLCNTDFTINSLFGQQVTLPDGGIPTDEPVTDPDSINFIEQAKCGFSSDQFRAYALAALAAPPTDAISHTDASVSWNNPPGCTGSDCRPWPYTSNDAQLGLICQGAIALPDPTDASVPVVKAIEDAVNDGDISPDVGQHFVNLGTAMQQFADSQAAMDAALKAAYIKMMNLKVVPGSLTMTINGQECGTNWKPSKSCGRLNPFLAKVFCNACVTGRGRCPSCCQCSGTLGNNVALSPSVDGPCAISSLPELCLSGTGFSLVE